ncbi:enterochelin ABC transporter, ATP-binding protein [Campylobacter jejuni subsp. jejuni HN-CJD07035]|uniref:ABC transporter ATP-binding protein n=1 Tax=Campylobacter jejuni TaxID=197 RepID=A0A5T0DYU2_CAMJU|nr:ABC transporter ATP-binding protein [Campylobacter jejuni]ADT66607.1 enterochelin ABC transporter, ATP-binding protein [Campylobacter jejuni subsp. jejuni ICDCCJ07001]ALF92361.1 enterochelin ABC transporter, ATP-binding protein [Campylobacter jejuni subsp. jejuni]ALF94000.1 enterochelin ABC transporter, ATP-binding protein [Campylobacter jejuni subsp. jejuni]EAI3784682.1 ABC transporter ATP-binding protein [Campylobacter jejuni]EAI4463184.1 ABC transporter ATP-binding protein [Campylobacter
MIKLKNITKFYDNKAIISDLSLDFHKGKITSIIGANGAGKSTLLALASRLIKPSSGEIYIDGMNLKDYKERILAQKISILKQQNNINLRLKVEELVAFGRFPHSQGRLNANDKIKINEALEYMGLSNLRNEFLDTLSGGQKQRAFIAMIIAQDTEFIMFDEPLNNLDMKHSVQIMQLMKNLVKDFNKSIAVVLHDINFASIYSDEIIALKDGKLLKQGSKDEIINQENLKQIYDMDIPVSQIDGKKICIYF